MLMCEDMILFAIAMLLIRSLHSGAFCLATGATIVAATISFVSTEQYVK